MPDYKTLAQGLFDSMAGVESVDRLIDQYMAEDFVEHEVIPGMDNTRETPRQLFKMMFTAFPDFRATVDEMLQDGDKVVARVTFSGTHEGEFMGVPASGNRVAWSAIDILQFRDDKVVAHWGVMDMAAAMAQMGAAHG
jgi:steroid delta-isomerase-like uncharacterized protein